MHRFPLVVIGPSVDTSTLRDVFATGIDGYLSKVMQISEISTALKAVLAGQKFAPAILVPDPPSEFEPPVGNQDDISGKFTPRQLEVLELIASGLSNKMIARSLSIAESTVKVHVNAAFHILGVHCRKSAIDALVQMETAIHKDNPDLSRILARARAHKAPARGAAAKA